VFPFLSKNLIAFTVSAQLFSTALQNFKVFTVCILGFDKAKRF